MVALVHTEVLRAANEHSIKVSELVAEDAAQIRKDVAQKYAGGRPQWLWEFAEKDATSVQDENAWRWITDFVGSNATMMFFNDSDSSTILLFQNGTDINVILAETFHFEFYLTDKKASYLLCFNHHDFLIGWGTAKIWLEERIKADT